ncbi:MAG: glycoside hydrolase family 25, partial [Frankiales bacterium]|nr:glycoside hydrolase family 25 [Frankiales bacterium]
MPKRALLLVLALFLAGLSGIGSAQAATKVLTGPDTARYQHPNGAAINWAAVRRAGQSWGFVKGTQGTDYVDPNFATDWRDVAAAGLYRGTYHYAQPSSAAGSAKAQADWFAKSIGVQTAPGTLPPILDLESSGNLSVASLKTWVQTFLTELQARTHRVPMVYSYPSFWKDNMGGTTAFARYPLWIAHYGVAKPTTYGWSTYTFWQYTSTGTVNGISTPGNTDLSRFNGTSLDLAALALAGTWKLPSKTANDTTGTTTSSPPSRYVSVAPQRLLDTRKSGGPVLGITDVALPASAVPADATAAVLDVTAVDAHGPGWIRAGAAGTALTATSLNYAGKVSSTGLVLAQPNSNGHIAIQTNASATDLVVDLVGYQSPDAGTGGHWVPLTPYRVVDSRTGHGLPKHTVSGAVTVTLPTSVPATASGVVLDLTAAAPTGTGFVRVNAAGDSGSTTTLTYARGISATGLAITRARG